MLRKIRSSYFTETILEFTEEKTKLNLLKYNKLLQNIVDLKHINYRILSRKYIIIEKRDFGKIYDDYNYQKLYEGEIINGERSGI